MKTISILLLVSLILLGCAASTSERIIGKWSGTQTNAAGNKLPATWEFIEGGTMVISITGLASYGATWEADGNRITIVTELSPDKSTYRDVEFINDDTVKMTKAEAGITETWTRVK